MLAGLLPCLFVVALALAFFLPPLLFGLDVGLGLEENDFVTLPSFFKFIELLSIFETF
jgi:hypothetical protein